jgi:tetratricopeptide (TPR) repeat protein
MAIACAQAPDPVTQPMADQVERLHREIERIRNDVHVNMEIEQAARRVSSDVAARAAAEGMRASANAIAMAGVVAQESRPGTWKGSGSSAYRRGLHALDERKWDDAVEYFKKTGTYRPDAALYWTAFAHYKAGRSDQSLLAISTLSNTHSGSAWLNDAKTLEVEVKAAQGRPVSPDSLQDDEIRLIAVSGLIRSDVDKAVSYLEKLVGGSQSPRVKEEALHMLARTNSPRARDLVIKVARSGNPDLQRKAIHAVSRMDPREMAASALLSIYGDTRDKEVKEEVLDALSEARAAKALVDTARAERDIELKKRAVRHLARMNSKEANEYLAELIK